jgi:hypothetical protein
MDLHLEVPVSRSQESINFNDKVTFIGSCFSDHMGTVASNHGLDVISNPFGTIFHPSPMARSIGNCIVKNSDSLLLKHNELVYDWDSSHLFYSVSESAHREKIQSTQDEVKSHLKGKSWLFITLGTSVAYRHKDSGLLVANCHKQNQNLFSKEQISSNQMYQEWREVLNKLYSLNNKLKVVFTVSPVRHHRDGLISNNISKSHLFILIEKLMTEFPATYFPSYEIINDALRDYRFFDRDLTHPNKLAIDYVWNHFSLTYFSENHQSLLCRIAKLNKAQQHRMMSKDHIEAEKLKEWIGREKESINKLIGRNLN